MCRSKGVHSASICIPSSQLLYYWQECDNICLVKKAVQIRHICRHYLAAIWRTTTPKYLRFNMLVVSHGGVIYNWFTCLKYLNKNIFIILNGVCMCFWLPPYKLWAVGWHSIYIYRMVFNWKYQICHRVNWLSDLLNLMKLTCT